MSADLPTEGAVDESTAASMHGWWAVAAAMAGIDLSGFDPAAPLAERLAWARSQGLSIAAALARFSTKLQHSTGAQLQQVVEWAGRNMCYVVPEFSCVDEGMSGRKMMRAGLERMTMVLHGKLIDTLLVYKVSRLLRVAYKGFAYIQENVVDEDLRAVSVSQGIDTADRKTWKAQMYLHGLMDDMLLDTIADHVRSGLHNLFGQGFTTGALPVGYKPIVVPGAAPTNRGLPRTRPGIDDDAAAMIVRHYEMCRDGLSISQGWQMWLAEGGPCDPRAKSKKMSYPAYRRMLSNPRYTGCWAFGKRKNHWSSKRECNRQIDQPESEVRIFRCEELRIVSDELYYAVQERLATLQHPPRPRRKDKKVDLCDLTTGLFYCAACSTPGNLVRYYQTGARGLGMQCKRGHLCEKLTALPRKKAVSLVCTKLQGLLLQDAELVKQIVCSAQAQDAAMVDDRDELIRKVENAVRSLGVRISDLQDLLGDGTEEDRRELKSKIRSAQAERQTRQAELQQLQNRREAARPILPEDVDAILCDLGTLLSDAAAGTLGEDAVHRAFNVFELMVGGEIMVHVDARPGRKRTIARGVFTPRLIEAVSMEAGAPKGARDSVKEVEVWLREPPFIDKWAKRAYELVDVQGESYRSAATIMNRVDGLKTNSGKVWQLRKRYYEMRGEPAPDREYNNGRPRRSP